jgi:cytochrome c oxidase subunit 1
MYNVAITMRKPKTAGDDPWDGRTLEWTIPSPPPEYNFETIPTVRARDPFWHDKYIDPLAMEPQQVSVGRDPAEQPSLLTPEPDGRGHDDHGSNGHAPSHNGYGAHAGGAHHGIHMPSPSYYPLVAAIGLVVAAYGLLLTREHALWYALAGVGVGILLLGVYGWTLEPPAEEHAA